MRRIRTLDKERVVAGWTIIIGTRGGHGFQVSGSHSLTFKDGKIATLRIVVSPKPDTAAGLTAEELAVEDIGRLSLAAWAVV